MVTTVDIIENDVALFDDSGSSIHAKLRMRLLGVESLGAQMKVLNDFSDEMFDGGGGPTFDIHYPDGPPVLQTATFHGTPTQCESPRPSHWAVSVICDWRDFVAAQRRRQT